jgi:hypothetical protein
MKSKEDLRIPVCMTAPLPSPWDLDGALQILPVRAATLNQSLGEDLKSQEDARDLQTTW